MAAGVSNAQVGLCDTSPRTQRDDLNPTGIRTAGIRMVPVVNGKYKVWIKKFRKRLYQGSVAARGPGIQP